MLLRLLLPIIRQWSCLKLIQWYWWLETREKHKSLARKYSYSSLAIALVMHVWSYKWPCANSLMLNAAGGLTCNKTKSGKHVVKINWSDLEQRFERAPDNLFYAFSFHSVCPPEEEVMGVLFTWVKNKQNKHMWIITPRIKRFNMVYSVYYFLLKFVQIK